MQPAGSIPSELDALQRLYEVGRRCVRPGNDFSACLQACLEAAMYVTGAAKGTLQIVDPESGCLVIKVQHGFGPAFLEFFSQVGHETAATCGAALAEAARVRVEDVTTSGLFAGTPSLDVLLAEGIHAVQSTPMVSSTQHVLGIISTHFDRPTRFVDWPLRLMDLLAEQTADYIERNRTEHRLRTIRSQLERITAEAGTMITHCSRDLRYLFVNKLCADFLGKPAELIVGRPVLEIIGEPAFHVIRPYVQRVLAGERVEYEVEIPYAKSGPRHMHVVYAPDIDSQGLVCGWIGTIADITARKDLETRLRVADRQKDEFLAMLAHELRNPLAPIRYALALRKKTGCTPEQLVRAEEVIERQVAHMSRLLDDLLDISRITRGRLTLKMDPTELTSILSAAIEAARPTLDAKGHTLSMDIPNQPVRLNADPVRLAQVFSNLLINAAKYTDHGGRIHLRTSQENDRIVVSVRDNGIGIPVELKPHLFTLFTQGRTAADRSEGGLGVGLSLVRGIVELHGGSVEAISEGLEQGSEFVVRLPVLPGAPAYQEAEPEPRRQSSQPELKILLADDNRDAVDICATLLQLSGYKVQIAYTGATALELAATFQPHACLLDIGLPDMDGYQLAGRIRAAVWGRNAFLVAVTGWGRDEDKVKAFAAGFDHHLTKPITGAALETLLQSASSRMLAGSQMHSTGANGESRTPSDLA